MIAACNSAAGLLPGIVTRRENRRYDIRAFSRHTQMIEVLVDIKPDSFPNKLNLKSKDNILV